MRIRTLGGAVLALALLAACAAPRARPTGTAESSSAPEEPYRACPGQEAEMAKVRERARRLPDGTTRRVVGVGVQTVEVSSRADLDTADLAARARASRAKVRTGNVEIELRVDASGAVTAARLLTGSGDAALDQHLVDFAREGRFDPATETAFPIPGCAIQTVPFELPAE